MIGLFHFRAAAMNEINFNNNNNNESPSKRNCGPVTFWTKSNKNILKKGNISMKRIFSYKV